VRQAPLRVHLDAVHPAEVDDDATVHGGQPGDVVPAAAYGERQAALTGHRHDLDHITGTPAAHDRRRSLVDHPVPDGPRRLVGVVLDSDDISADAPPRGVTHAW
jgi:hypothetical protein